MKLFSRWLIALLVLAGLLLTGCGPAQIPVTGDKPKPAVVEPIEGTKFKRVTLTQKAAERLGIQTVLARGTSIPYAAVIYDTEGNTWIYTNPEPLVFIRQPVMVDRIEGDQAILSKGLEAEIVIVTVGVSELYGAETGVSK